MIRPFLRRRGGMEPPVYLHPDLRPGLAETFGVIVYHEQVMRTLSALAGYDLTYADHVRRNLDDPEMLPALRADFLRRTDERGIDHQAASKTWEDLAQFASFGFCKAHAAAFAVPTYQSAWLKAHYPAHLIAGLLTYDPGMYPRRLILEDARRHGIPILALDVNRSEREYVVEEVEASEQPFGIRLALQDVHGIDDSQIRSILAGRADKAFRDVPDFLRRTKVSRPVTEALAHAGAFDSLKADRRGNLYAAMTTEAQREGDQMTLADAAAPLHRFKDYSDAEVVRAELQVLGMDASRHIISFFEPLLADLGVTRTRDLSHHRGGDKVMVAGVKVASQTPAIRSGQRIIFLTLDDATGLVEVTVFESVQPKVAKTVFHSYAMVVWGELRRTGVKGLSVVAEEIWDLTELHHARGRGELAQVMAGEKGSGASGLPQAGSPSRALWHASGGSAG
jgi:error-prone DNA polymerase